MPANTICFIKKLRFPYRWKLYLNSAPANHRRAAALGNMLTQPSQSEPSSRDRKRLNLLSEQAVRLLRVLSGGAMRRGWSAIAIIAATIGIGGIAGNVIRMQTPVHSPTVAAAPEFAGVQRPNQPALYMEAYVTGYNTVRNQTDDTPCIAASGANICGRRDTVACPRLLEFGTVVEINGRKYVCADRMAARFRGGFDINCDKDRSCPYEVAGWTTVRIFLE